MLVVKTVNLDEINDAKLLLYQELFEPLGMPRETQESLNKVELHHAATSKEYRGQGIGKKLWQEVLRFFEAVGINVIELYSRNTAIDFWKSVGFTEVTEEWFEVESFEARH